MHDELTPAIPAAHHPLGFALIYRLLIRWPLWNSFDCVRAQVVGRMPRRADGPLLCYMNHCSWWDGYMAAIVSRCLLRPRVVPYVMMEEAQLRAYRFFTMAGAFSVDRHNPREAARAVAYISRVLRARPGRALCMFPQGEIVPNDRRPLHLYTGLAHVARRMERAVLAPVALRYEFRGEQRPEIFIRFGPLHHVRGGEVDTHALTREMAQRLTAGVDALRDAVVADDTSGFRVLLRGRAGVNRWFDDVLARLRGA